MSENTTNTNEPTTNSTLSASELSYYFEKNLIQGKSGVELVDAVEDEEGVDIPSNLEYLRSDYDEATGTSGVAFRDTDTGEIILAYTGTNPNGDFNTDVVMADGAGIAAGTGVHYQSAFDFYEEIRDEYGEPTLTGHSLGGNIAQRVAIKYNVQNTVVYNAAPLYIPGAITLAQIHSWLANLSPEEQKLAIQQVMAVPIGNAKDIEDDLDHFTGTVTRIRTGVDPLNAVAQAAQGVYVGDEYLIGISGHGLAPLYDNWKQSRMSAILTKRQMAATQKNVLLDLTSLSAQKQLLAADGLSDSEKIYLDGEQARIVATGLTSIAELVQEEANRQKSIAVERAEEIYQTLYSIVFKKQLCPLSADSGL